MVAAAFAPGESTCADLVTPPHTAGLRTPIGDGTADLRNPGLSVSLTCDADAAGARRLSLPFPNGPLYLGFGADVRCVSVGASVLETSNALRPVVGG